ncbi:restriction endonuclease subunit S [Methanosarcina sp. 2.H.A.1B.4]|uniref:restriction endonuclease subunit S n=1 Tax=Methanosarcina sp. 2.H.A.1B.4 TaxID=1483600 RepID=UPI000621E9A3|nr:restriction endonuclease subunit S [Methanosarcina sp. 2.H.A.1B.4]KKG09665.1 hypothetical protein EO92_04965 [Methanosarcina sp. 2.H.A.1B.4]
MSWETVTFGSICNLVNGKAFKPSDWSTSGVPIIRIQNLNGAGKPFNFWAGSFENQVLVKAGDLLLAWSGTPGTSFGSHIWYGPDSVLNQHIFRCDIDRKRVTPEWVKFAVNVQLDQLIQLSHGGVGLKHVTRRVVEELKIPLPTLEEQKRIAEILDRAEALRAKRRAALAQLDELTQAIFIGMFGDPVKNPKNWDMTKLGECIEFMTSGSRGWAKYYSDAGEKFIRIQNVKNGKLDFSDIQLVKPPKTAESIRTKVKDGDLLISITADLGRTAVVDDQTALEGAYINQHLALIRLNKKIVDPVFVSQYLESEGGKRQFSSLDQKGVKSGLNFENVKSLEFYLPPLDMQKEFSLRIATLEKLKVSHKASLGELDELFASLQYRAFRGEL